MANTTKHSADEIALTLLATIAPLKCFALILKHFEIIVNGDLIDEDAVGQDHDGVTLSLEESVGGCEGDGEYVSRVYGLTVGDKILAHVSVTGFYESYEGTTWDDTPSIVYPHRVTVTQFKRDPQ